MTGSQGYVGSVLCDILSEQRHDIIGFDTKLYPLTSPKHHDTRIHHIKKDIRDITPQDIKGYDAIMHLAALSNDPLGELNPRLTDVINHLATMHLARVSVEAGVRRFIYSSSCSTYGAQSDIVDEDSALEPLTAYARSKVDSERGLVDMSSPRFCPVILRNATAFGFSPYLRLDIVVNNLVAHALATGNVEMHSDGTAWRPLVHVQDMARAFIVCASATEPDVQGQIFNVGSNENNFQVRHIAEHVARMVPDSKITYSKGVRKDSRSYQVKFDKIANVTGYTTEWALERGINDIIDGLHDIEFSGNDIDDSRFYRVPYLKRLLEKGLLAEDLRPIK